MNRLTLKYLFLVVLVFQSSSMYLVTRYSLKYSTGPKYLPSTLVFFSEVVKLLILSVIVLYKFRSIGHALVYIKNEIFLKPKESIKMSVPAFLYLIQNNLLFVAVAYLDTVTCQVTYQLKILTTAFFSVWLLEKSLTKTQWFSLITLTLGVIMMQFKEMNKSDTTSKNVAGGEKVIGLAAILVNCCLSGFSGVYAEKLLKSGRQSKWIRNIQLALWSIPPAIFVILARDYSAIQRHGLLQGWTKVTFVVLLLHSFGGIVVALVVFYSDNIMKNFANAFTVFVCIIASHLLLDDFSPTLMSVLGAMTVILSTVMYTKQT